MIYENIKMNLMTERYIPKEVILKQYESEERDARIPQKGDSARGSSNKRRYYI